MRYVVQPGQSLSIIARLFGIALNRLIATNPQITDPNRIVPGEIIEIPVVGERVPGGFDRPYIVRRGDTLFQIARTFGVGLDAVIGNNPQIADPSRIFPGEIILVPGGPVRPPEIEGCIAFISTLTGTFELALIGAGLPQPRPVTFRQGDLLSRPSWSPDGRFIAMGGTGNRLLLVEPATQQVSVIARDVPLEVLSYDWSPDGRLLAFQRDFDIYIVEVPRGEPRLVISDAREPRFFPDGRRLLVAATRDEFEQLFSIDLNGKILRQITNNTDGPLGQVTLSPSGERVVFSQPGAAISVFTILDVETGRTFPVTPGPFVQDFNPRWSPDGELLAFYSRDFDRAFFTRLRLVTKDGRDVREVIRSSCDAGPDSLAWSPDGSRLVFIDCPAGQPDLFTVRPDGSDVRRLTTFAQNMQPDWTAGACPAL